MQESNPKLGFSRTRGLGGAELAEGDDASAGTGCLVGF